jgi:hypothetical protein
MTQQIHDLGNQHTYFYIHWLNMPRTTMFLDHAQTRLRPVLN